MKALRRPGTLLPRLFYLLLSLWVALLLLRGSSWIADTERVPDFKGPFTQGGPRQLGVLPTRMSPGDKLDISMEFRIDQKLLERMSDEGRQYAGLFQTASGEQGFRIEMGLSRTQYNNWGISIAGQHFDLGRIPATDRWHKLRLVAASRSATLTIDGIRLIHLDRYPDKVRLDVIRAGYGFSPDRLFPGQIRDFSISLTPYDALTDKAQKVVATLLATVLLLWLIEAVRIGLRNSRNPFDSVPVRWLSALAYLGCFFWLKSHYTTETGQELLTDIALAAVLMASILAALDLPPRRRVRQVIVSIAIGLNYCTYALLMAGATYLRGRAEGTESGLTFDEIGVLHQSNIAEALEFFLSSFSLSENAGILLFPILPSLALYLLTRIRFPQWGTTSSALVGVSGLVAGPFLLSTDSGIAATIYGGWQSYADVERNFSTYRQLRSKSSTIEATKPETGETYVLVIGESANRNHFSAYGYFRPTTPWLDQQRKSQDGIFFENAYASYVHTVPALMQALTAANQYTRESSLSSPTLIEVFRAAGFHTIWLSEQTMSWADTPLHTLAAEASQIVQVRSPGKIVPKFRETLQSLDRTKNNLIIVHMMGSHADYRNRYPLDYASSFSRAPEDLGDHAHASEFLDRLLDPYDLSIHYTDHQLAEMEAALSAAKLGKYAFIFVADHGEDVFGQRFHNAANFSFSMTHIPLFMRFSTDWVEQNRMKHSQLQQHRSSIFTLDLLYDTMVGLAGIRTQASSAGFDLSHPRYMLNEQSALTMRPPPDSLSGVYANVGERSIRDDPRWIAQGNMRFLNRKFPGRFLANWADSLARASEADALEFEGLEVNVGVPSMHIGHYPEIVHARTLEQYLALPVVRNKQRLWLDLKLESGRSVSESLAAMESLDGLYSLKARAIIESPERGLAAFAARGWHTSYYFIPERWPGCLNDENSRRQCAADLALVVKEQKLGAVSFDTRYYSFIDRYVAPLLPPMVAFHTFGADLPSIFAPDFREKLLARSEVRDRRIKTILLEGSQTFHEGRKASQIPGDDIAMAF
ncbi:sulfatase-like hydrolase/transferase [Sulfuritalea sp.]|uniref:sulfatase-like hydrolase/transferase n=1 Tax=Sulfuritalea sp. TaxID=2480090 RepID=UPI00286D8CBB|nr:sulfatase-like hydrolase/transferase [Sulfuritalea sp.]